MQGLTQEEIDSCRAAFLTFDKDRSGTIDAWELRQVLEQMGEAPTEDELFQMISDVDENMSGSIDFGEFLKVVQGAKQKLGAQSDDEEILDAFIACGGKSDKTGHVKKDNLVKIIKNDFGLAVNVEELINKYDRSGSGNLSFSDFHLLLSS